MSDLPKKSIKFASINIQGDKHLDTVLSFLKGYSPDVVCFQELSEKRVEFFEKELDMKGVFTSMTRKRYDDFGDPMPPGTPIGIGIFSKFPITQTSVEYYYGDQSVLPTLVLGDETTIRRPLLRASFEKEREMYTVATTHFTRTADGSTSDKQRVDMKNLLAILSKLPEVILCGDFNAPRGLEIFGVLSDKYKDNIPAQYVSSLDPNLHKLRGSKSLMVDGLFTTPGYLATEVKLTQGVSDHLAVTSVITIVKS